MTQSGSSVANFGGGNTPVGMTLGYFDNSFGRYTINGGTLTNHGGLIIGERGKGEFNQAGGSTTINGNLVIGNQGPGNGTLNSTGGNFTVTGNTTVGRGPRDGGFGVFNVNGNVTLHNVYLNYNGDINLGAGGTLTLDAAYQQFTSSPTPGEYFNGFHWTGGTLNIPEVSISYISRSANFGLFSGDTTINDNVTLNARYLGVGDVSGYSALLIQNAGTFNIGTPTTAGTFTLGIRAQSGGTYNLNGTGKLKVIGTASINPGNMNIGGGAMNVTGPMSTSDQSNMTLTADSLTVSGAYDSGANFNQSGGTLAVGGNVTHAPSSMNITGGTATVGGELLATSAGAVVNVGGANTSLTVTGNTTIGNPGANNAYSGLKVSGGTFKANSSLFLTTASEIKLSGGTLRANTATFAGTVTQTNGTLTVVGKTSLNGGKLNVSAGSSQLGGDLEVNNAGIVSLSNGASLNVNGQAYLGGTSTRVGGVGVYKQSGGTASFNSGMIAYGGLVTLDGGQMGLSNFVLGTTANFTQNGGTLGANNINATNAQSFTMNGGTLSLVGGTFAVPAIGFRAGDGTKAATFLIQQNATVTGGRVTVPAPSAMQAAGAISGGLTLDGELTMGVLTLGGSTTFSATSKTNVARCSMVRRERASTPPRSHWVARST